MFMDAVVSIILGIQGIVFILGFSGVVYWLSRMAGALKGAVDAQEKIIAAQGELLKTMKDVLESTDEPKMLERIQAYKEFVNEEKQAELQKQAQHFTEKEDQTTDVLEYMNSAIGGLIEISTAMLPYVPSNDRDKLIDLAKLPTSLKGRLQQIAKKAPQLPRAIGSGKLYELYISEQVVVHDEAPAKKQP